MPSIVVDNNNTYLVNGTKYFHFTSINKISRKSVNYRDFNCDLEKNSKYELELIAYKCKLKYSGLKKQELLNLIINSGEILFI